MFPLHLPAMIETCTGEPDRAAFPLVVDLIHRFVEVAELQARAALLNRFNWLGVSVMVCVG